MSQDGQSELHDLLSEFPFLNALHDWAIERAISIQVEPANIASDGYDPRLLTITSPTTRPIRFVAFDEYIEARSDNVLLGLILLENDMTEIVDSGGIEYWTAVNFLDPANAVVQQVFADNTQAHEALLADYGPIPDARFNWELEMGVQAGDVLRNMKISAHG